MTSKCGKNKKSGTRGDSRVCHWCSYHILTMHGNMNHNLFGLYNNEAKLLQMKLFIWKSFSKGRPLPLWRTRKQPFDVTYYLYKMKRSHWLLRVAKNCAWSRKITPLSNLTRASLSRKIKTYSEGRIDLRNLQFLKLMLDKVKSVFVIGAAQWVEKLGCCLESCRSRALNGKER